MKIEVLGRINFMSTPKIVQSSDGKEHSFMTLWIKTLEDSYIAVNCWDNTIEKTKSFKVSDIVTLNCKLESHRNKKNTELFYHKIMLLND